MSHPASNAANLEEFIGLILGVSVSSSSSKYKRQIWLTFRVCLRFGSNIIGPLYHYQFHRLNIVTGQVSHGMGESSACFTKQLLNILLGGCYSHNSNFDMPL